MGHGLGKLSTVSSCDWAASNASTQVAHRNHRLWLCSRPVSWLPSARVALGWGLPWRFQIRWHDLSRITDSVSQYLQSTATVAGAAPAS